MSVKLYYGKASKGYWIASRDKGKLKMLEVFECNVETVHNNRVYMLTIYKGYDYNYGSVISINSVTAHSILFHSVSKLKKECKAWKEASEKAKENPEDYHVTDFSIASDDYGSPFEYGDCFQGKFNMKIIPVKVI